MGPSRHLVLTTAAALPLAPLVGWRAATFWAAAILIDVDHYFWYVRRYRRWNPLVAYSSRMRLPQGGVRPLFHRGAFVGLLAAGTAAFPALLPILAGVLFHHLLDDQGRIFVKALHGFRCWDCGSRMWRIEVHKAVLTAEGRPGYPRRRVTLCRACHVLAHQKAGGQTTAEVLETPSG